MKPESPAFLFPADHADAIPATSIQTCPADVSCGESQIHSVGAGLRDLSLREIEAHAASCHYLCSLAKARYRGSKALADAQEAGRWAVLEEEAGRAVLAARRAQFDADHLDMAGEWTRQIA